MKIKIKKRTQNTCLVMILFIGPYILAPLTQFLHFPSSVKYILDITCVLIFLTMVMKKKRVLEKDVKILKYWILAFFCFSIMNYILHYQSIFYFLWGIRNNFRGYILFFAVIFYFKENDVNDCLNKMDQIFYINAALMIFQFLVLGYQQDNLGGIFGVESGSNGLLNVFFCVMLIKGYVYYLEKKESISNFIIKIIFMLALASLAELKFFYIEFICILVIAILVTRFSWRKFGIVTISIVALIIGYNVLMLVFPDTNMSIDSLYKYASSDAGYTSSGDLNRLNFLKQINERYFISPIDRMTGMGIGNCDYATNFDFLTTSFYKENIGSHYYWFSSGFTYIENGWVGLIFFFGFFILIAVLAYNKSKTNRKFSQIALLCAIAAIMNGFYNISLRVESCYIMYFMLALPWCLTSNNTNTLEKKECDKPELS